MSIPGLGILPSAPPKPTTHEIDFPPLSEYRILIPRYTAKPLILTLLGGTAERDGVELARNVKYYFRGPIQTKLFTFSGATLSAEDISEDSTCNIIPCDGPDTCSTPQYLNLHLLLEKQRLRTVHTLPPSPGPRVLITGHQGTGKTSLAKTLVSWATKCGGTPMIVNLDPQDAVLTLPGTISAAVMATSMDIETKWGVTPSSGPSPVPVKLPIVQYFGRRLVSDAEPLWRSLVDKLSQTVTARLHVDADVRTTGLVIDTQGLASHHSHKNYKHEEEEEEEQRGLRKEEIPPPPPSEGEDEKKGGMDIESLAHAVQQLSITIIIVLAQSPSDEVVTRVEDRFRFEKTAFGEQVRVIQLAAIPKDATKRDDLFLQHEREAAIKEYFFGDVNRTLSPFTQMVEFDGLAIWMNWDDTTTATTDEKAFPLKPLMPSLSSISCKMMRVREPRPDLSTWCLAVMCAPLMASGDEVQHASVKGFVYVADVDRDRRRLKILTPVSGRLDEHPLLWGRWPEPFINLLG